MPRTARIVLAGDISPGEHYFTLGHGVVTRGLRQGFDYLFDACREWFRLADVGFANLEGVLSSAGLRRDDVESRVFRGVPEMAAALSRAGITVVSIANNHVLQHGTEAFDDTLRVLRAHGIAPCGERGDTPYSSRPVVVEAKNARIGFLAYSAVPEQFLAGEVPYARFRLADAIRDAADLRGRVDFVVASVHIGRDGSGQLDAEDVRALHALAGNGVDVVAAHHSHVFQRVECRDAGIVCHNLGDFVFDLHWHAPHRRTALVDVELGDCPRRSVATLRPFFIGPDFAPRPATSAGETSSWTTQAFAADAPGTAPGEPAEDGLLALRKLVFFLLHLPLGATGLKLQFLLAKMKRRVWPGGGRG
jgi:gamma-polyglutamate biosynthesis protein CapA